MTETTASFDQWGIVEVMGHKKYAGHITEETIAGAAFVRVDVPELVLANGEKERTLASFTKFVGPGSIYMIHPTTEEIARKAAREIGRYDSPLPVQIPVERQLPATTAPADDVDDDVESDFALQHDEDRG
jgi:hypothetical protein